MNSEMLKIKKMMNGTPSFSKEHFYDLYKLDLKIGLDISLVFQTEFQRLYLLIVKNLANLKYDNLLDLISELRMSASYISANSIVWICDALFINIKKKDKRLLNTVEKR